jgi:hypothetical protein
MITEGLIRIKRKIYKITVPRKVEVRDLIKELQQIDTYAKFNSVYLNSETAKFVFIDDGEMEEDDDDITWV